jgi:hypothetical protein
MLENMVFKFNFPTQCCHPERSRRICFSRPQQQILTLRYAPVGMTGFGGVTLAGICGRCQQIKVDTEFRVPKFIPDSSGA